MEKAKSRRKKRSFVKEASVERMSVNVRNDRILESRKDGGQTFADIRDKGKLRLVSACNSWIYGG